METLLTIDKDLIYKVDAIRNLALEMQFSRICNFELSETSLSNIPWQDLQYSGIYFLEIQNCKTHNNFSSWAFDFQTKWLDDKYRRRFVANPKKSRIAKHSTIHDWIPLYIGKSKNISKRVWEHIFLGLDKPTFAMKLACRDHLKDNKFQLSCIQVAVENYDWIMPILEKTLRDRFNPIIGRQ